jgi:hypothetical protein
MPGNIKKVIIKISVVVVVVIVGVALLYTYWPLLFKREVKKSIDLNIVFEQVVEIAEYATLSCPYTTVETLTKETPVLWGLTKSVGNATVMYSGTIKLGIDGKDIKINTILNTINIDLPPIKVLSHEQHEPKIVGKNDGVFSKVEDNDYYWMLAQVKTKEEELLMNSDSPRNAKENLEKRLKGFLDSLPGIETYRVSIKWE